MKKMLFVFNPWSGKAKIKSKLADIINIFVKNGFEVTVYPTQENQDGLRKVRECGKDYDIVVCSGGDGTLNEVVTGLIEGDCGVDFGYIPSGTTNDFATSLHLSLIHI